MSNLRKMLLTREPRRLMSRTKDCTPVKWTNYFDSEEDVTVGEDKFHIYRKGDTGPLLVPLHGGGYNALTWCLFVEEICKKAECQIVAIDLRGHGSTQTGNEELSLENLARDVSNVLNTLYNNYPPAIVLIGHSMGGAVAVETAPLLPTLRGVCVIDVVEGTALDCLSSMQSILRGRPSSFKSVEQAILWCFKGGQTQNMDAARVSMPGQIKNKKTGVLAANEDYKPSEQPDDFKVPAAQPDAISEEGEEPESNGCANVAPDNTYVWRIDLSKTERFWRGWFKGLSQKFLEVDAPKVLLLANIQGLDTSLTIGQMQGKFQMQVLQRSGHAIHEDQPGQVADIIASFLVKQRIANKKEGYVCPIMPAC